MKKYFLNKVLVVFLFTILTPLFAHAGTSDNLTGYAWSSNIGWISFNCTNDNSCASSNYGVNKDNGGNLVGYAWSSNIGWIQFGGLSGFPTGAGTTAQNAQVVGNGLIGWARALSNGSGWDGWISFTGTGYGVTTSGLAYTGYAWGSDVIGWLSFDVAGANGVKISGDATIAITGITAGTTVPYGTVPTFNWTITNVSGSCSITKIAGGSPFSTPITNKTVSGSQPEDPLTASGLHTYSIDCTNPTISKQFSFTVDTQPPGFIISGPVAIPIQFLGTGAANSSNKTYTIDNGGTSFASAVNVSVTSITNDLGYSINPSTVSYSFDGGSTFKTLSQSPNYTVAPPHTPPHGFNFKVRFNTPTSTQYTIRLTGVDQGGVVVNQTKDIRVIPVLVTPAFDER